MCSGLVIKEDLGFLGVAAFAAALYAYSMANELEIATETEQYETEGFCAMERRGSLNVFVLRLYG